MVDKLPFDICLPAVGQGALAVQIREDDDATAALIAPMDDPTSHAAVTAERAMLAALGGGCQTPIAGVAALDGENLVLTAMVASLDGKRVVRARETDIVANAKSLGERVAAVLLEAGAREILLEVREEAGPTDMGAA
jgi:hydroxymethylbilane synthase